MFSEPFVAKESNGFGMNQITWETVAAATGYYVDTPRVADGFAWVIQQMSLIVIDSVVGAHIMIMGAGDSPSIQTPIAFPAFTSKPELFGVILTPRQQRVDGGNPEVLMAENGPYILAQRCFLRVWHPDATLTGVGRLNLYMYAKKICNP